MPQTTHPNPEALAESITIILDDLGLTIEDLEGRDGQFRSEDERRAWHMASELSVAGLVNF